MNSSDTNVSAKIELEMAIDQAGLNAAGANDFSTINGQLHISLLGTYTVNEIRSLLADAVRVEAALVRVAR
jgi:hypothetical protein